jgi:hypothetical protein
VLDFLDNKNSLNISKPEGDFITVKAFLYDADNKLVNFEEAQKDKFSIEWSWYNIRLDTTDSALIKINGNIINTENSVVVNTLSTENYDKVNLSLFATTERKGDNINYENDAMNGKYLHIL